MNNYSYYVCKNNHQLIWNQSSSIKCQECGQNNCYSRYKCNQCDEYYCVKCKQPPVMGDFCGGGHIIKFEPKLLYHSCDVCRVSIQKGAYRCQQCDYDVCSNCWIIRED